MPLLDQRCMRGELWVPAHICIPLDGPIPIIRATLPRRGAVAHNQYLAMFMCDGEQMRRCLFSARRFRDDPLIVGHNQRDSKSYS